MRILYNNNIEKSYLDYFITLGFTNTKFNINLSIGKSDHLSLELYIPKNEIGQLVTQKEIIYPFNRIIKDSEKIEDLIINNLKNKNKVENIINIIKNLNINYKPKIKKANKGCIFLNKIDNYNNKFKKGQNFDKLKKHILYMSCIEYSSFIKVLINLYIVNRKKEFFQE